MSPVKYEETEQQQPKRVSLNGTRPSPLKLNKDSHVINKGSSSQVNVMNQISKNVAKQQSPVPIYNQPRQPVIIYSHSPTVIHTQPKDFMALVQKLTGLSRSDDHNQPAKNIDQSLHHHHTENQSSSGITADEKYGGGGSSIADRNESSSSISSPMLKASNHHFDDIPVFTPNSNDLFCSPRPLFRYSDAFLQSPNLANSMSPSFLEFIKGLPEC